MLAEGLEDGGALMSVLENIIDTMLNITVFLFIGVLIWLYLRKEPDSPATDEDKKRRKG